VRPELEAWDRIESAHLHAVPAAHAVIVLVDAQDHCILCAATGDARAFCEKRREQIEDAHHRVSVYALACGSMFEAEFNQLRFTQKAMPEVYRQTVEAWEPWFLFLDRSRGTWKAGTLRGGADRGDPIAVLGPMPDKHAPVFLGELLDDVFDLCREPPELGKAPHGRACPYKEMGRCPAPCDGSEPWPAFLARFAAATRVPTSLTALIQAIETRMREAGARCDFERGAHLKELAASLQARRGKRLTHITHLSSFSKIAVVPTTGRRSRVYLCRADGLLELAHLDRDPDPAACRELAGRIRALEPLPESFSPNPDQCGEVAFLSHRLFMPRRPEVFLSLDEGSNPDILRRAAARTPEPEYD